MPKELGENFNFCICSKRFNRKKYVYTNFILKYKHEYIDKKYKEEKIKEHNYWTKGNGFR